MKDLLASKKFKAALADLIVAAVGVYFDVDTEQLLLIMTPLLGYIGGQALADHGKEKAIVNRILGGD